MVERLGAADIGMLVAYALGRHDTMVFPFIGAATFLAAGYRIPLSCMLWVGEASGDTRSMLQVAATRVERPRFPVIDLHTGTYAEATGDEQLAACAVHSRKVRKKATTSSTCRASSTGTLRHVGPTRTRPSVR